MSADIKTVRQVCKCENCGNESEMVVTCALEDVGTPDKAQAETHDHAHSHKAKGTATCTNCGNEADMWVDI